MTKSIASPSQPEFRALFQSASEPRLLLDKDYTILAANEAYMQAKGMRLEEILGKKISDFLPEEASQKGNQFLQHFAHLVAHDLQSPLYAVAGCTQLLQEECAGKLNGQAEIYMTLIQENIRRMQVLIQDLQAYCRVDGQIQVIEAVNLRIIFDEAVFALAKPIADSGAEVLCSNLPSLQADRAQMVQLFVNLIGNAIKFRHAGRPPQVRVSAEPRGEEWVFSVRDNGIGIAPQYHQQIFDIFRRLHSQHAYPGSGLGLSICQRILERHGGRIWAESREGEGSTFYFTLPAEIRNSQQPHP